MIKKTEGILSEFKLTRRHMLQGMGTVAAVSATGFTGFGASAASEVKELIVLTGTTPWLPAYQKAAAAYEAEKGVKITFRPFPYGGMRTQMTNAIQSKNAAFDVFQLTSRGLANSTTTAG